MTPVSSNAPHGQSPLRTVQVLGGGNAGSSAHVRSLAEGLVARGVRVTVCAPHRSRPRLRVHRGRRRTRARAAQQRPRLRGRAPHGLRERRPRARARPARLLPGRPRAQRTHHPAGGHLAQPGPRGGARGRICCGCWSGGVVRTAAVVLGTSSDLVDRARRTGARDARLAAVALPARRRAAGLLDPGPDALDDPDPRRPKIQAELGATGRPLLIAVGSLDRQRGYDVLLDAARGWRDLDPVPLVVVAGEGPLRPVLQRRIEDEELPVRLIGAPRGRLRAARRRRSGAAHEQLGVPVRPRPGGAARARTARRDPGRRHPGPRRRRGRTRPVRRSRGPRPHRRMAARRPGAVRDAAGARRPAGRHLAHRGRDRRPSAQRLRRVDPAAAPGLTTAQGTCRRARSARLNASTVCGSSRSVPSNSPIRASRLYSVCRLRCSSRAVSALRPACAR